MFLLESRGIANLHVASRVVTAIIKNEQCSGAEVGVQYTFNTKWTVHPTRSNYFLQSACIAHLSDRCVDVCVWPGGLSHVPMHDASARAQPARPRGAATINFTTAIFSKR